MGTNRVAALREERGLTQKQLEDRTGIERSKLSRIESGDRRITATEALYLAEAFGVTPEDVLGERPRVVARFRGGAVIPGPARETAEWFRHFVDDALFVDRTARRYGVE